MPKQHFFPRILVAAIAISALAITGCDRDDSTTALTTPSNPTPTTDPSHKPMSALINMPTEPVTETEVTTNYPAPVGPVKPDKVLAQVIQTVEGFDHPQSCTLSLDNKFLFVSSSSVSINGTPMNKGFVSKLEVQEDGRLKMVKKNLIEKLHCPMGLAVLPKATKKYPVGSLFVCTGLTAGIDEHGDKITDIKKFNPGISIFDPDNGQMLGFIPMSAGRAVAKSIFHPVLAPVSVMFDPDGNLYFADAGNTGKELDPEIFGRPGIMRILAANIDSYADDRMQGNVSYLPVRRVPGALYYSKVDDEIFFTTTDGNGGGGGAVYRLPRKQYPQENTVENVVGDLGPLFGIAITPVRAINENARLGGSLIVSRASDGDLFLVTLKQMRSIEFAVPNFSLTTPSNMTQLTLPSGVNILYVPEQEPNSADSSAQRLRVVMLPSSL